MKRAILYFAILFGISFYTKASNDSLWLKIEVFTDNNASETSWDLKDKDGSILLFRNTFQNTTLHKDSVFVPMDSCYRFTLSDVGGNGFQSGGFLRIWENDSQVVYLDNYQDEATYDVNCQVGESCLDAKVIPAPGFFFAGFEKNWFTFIPDSSGVYQFTTCGIQTCDTKLWLYDDCPLVFGPGPEGTVAYNDDKCLQEAEISSYLQKDSLYYLRLEDNGHSCSDPLFFELRIRDVLYGCLDTLACNYDPIANTSDTSCLYYPNPLCHPDLVIDQSELKASLFLDSVQVNSSDYCLIQEGCVAGTGLREVIKFSTRVKNIGGTDFYLGNPRDNPDEFNNTNCHGHYHYEGYADYFLINKSGYKIPIGFKNGFCLMDSDCDVTSPKFNCQTQGISESCSDLYDFRTECQWVDVTDIPDGEYILVNRINGGHKRDAFKRYEVNYENNWAQTCIAVSRTNGKLEILPILDCNDFYDCNGQKFGTSTVDCNGDCGGTSIYGDAHKDGHLNTLDLSAFREISLNEGNVAFACLDLNQDAKIDIADAYHVSKCINHEDLEGTEDHSHAECVFPKITKTSQEQIQFDIDSLNRDSNFLLVSLNTNGALLSGFQINFEGIEVKKVEGFTTSPLLFDRTSVQYLESEGGLSSSQNVTVCKVYFGPIEGAEKVRLLSNGVALDSIGRYFMFEPPLYEYTLSSQNKLLRALSEDWVKVVPNPSSEHVTIRPHPSLDKFSLTIVSNLGVLVLHKENKSGSLGIDISEWPSGCYHVQLKSGNYTANKRLIVY